MHAPKQVSAGNNIVPQIVFMFKACNVVRSKGSDLAHRGDGFCEISNADASRFVALSTEDACLNMELLISAKQQVMSGELAASRYTKLEMATGFSANPHGILADKNLSRAIDVMNAVTWDWVHNSFQDGTFNAEVTALLQHTGVAFSTVREFLADEKFCFPSASRTKAKQLHRVFSEWRASGDEKSDKHKVKASASECLGLYSMLRHFVGTRMVDEASAPQRASFSALCKSIDAILLAKRGIAEAIDASRCVQQCMSEHLSLHTSTYGLGRIRPKHHWNMDVAAQIAKDKHVLDTFIIERRHLQIKKK